ncbi:30S ribosomal protein S14 [Phycicoccus sp. HDW14]|uniref:30S ribosomal protein S14 n=1 Tax=Phycicoccus sp. HDW14 TaxID=2714941 RepID=UPI001409D337|nr:30S ribosomal protein S14 [Phycicoccus sp. HDW14]QIM22546.1 30S ribosomal protein S14 [Phycicoccus sp. HDW14]
MARRSLRAADDRRRAVVTRYAERRTALREAARDPRASEEARAAARLALRRLPRDASPTRLVNRDVVDGRPRAVYRAFGLSRIRLREMAHRGELPGVTTSSW